MVVAPPLKKKYNGTRMGTAYDLIGNGYFDYSDCLHLVFFGSVEDVLEVSKCIR